jgi:hypothetical protein
MGDEPDTWVDRLKRRPLVAALIATAVALGGVLTFTTDFVNNARTIITDVSGWINPKADTNKAYAYSADLLIGNVIMAKTPRGDKSSLGDVPPPPPRPSRAKQQYKADALSLTQILNDMQIDFDLSNFQLDPMFFDSACTMSQVNQLYETFQRKYDVSVANAFRDGCRFRTIWNQASFGRPKATIHFGTPLEDDDVKEFLRDIVRRYKMNANIERDLVWPLDRSTLIRNFEDSLARRLGAVIKGQYQFL